jgi:hypothetical protein
MRNKESFQPELELVHKDPRSQFAATGRLVGRLAIDAIGAIGSAIKDRNPIEGSNELYPERVVVDFIEGDVAYAEIERPDGNVNQLVLPFPDSSFLNATK